MSDLDLSTTTTPAHPTHGPTVVEDLPCSGCGYSLRGLGVDQKCPECGRAIALSIRGERLWFAPTSYVASLHRGLSILVPTVFVYLVLSIPSVFWSFPFTPRNARPPAALVVDGLLLLCDVAFIVGYWLFTTPDAAYTGRERPTSSRNTARITACIVAAANLGRFLVKIIEGPGGGNFTPQAITGYAFIAIAWLAWTIQIFAIIRYVEHLARRIPDRILIGTTDTNTWLLPLLFVLGFPAFCVGPIVALVLYGTMLWNLRTRTALILQWQRDNLPPAHAA
jgi:hypothetical protein